MEARTEPTTEATSQNGIFRRTAILLSVLAIAAVLTGCDLPYAKAGTSCSPEGDYAQDNTYVLKCENGRWVKKATTEAADDAFEEAFGYRPGPNRPPAQPKPECRNSYDPRCGPFRYDPVPTDQPVQIRGSFATTANPDIVRLTVKVHDPDANIRCRDVTVRGLNDGFIYPLRGCSHDPAEAIPECRPRFGRWDPPARAKEFTDHLIGAVDLVAREPATTVVEIIVSAPPDCGNFYSSSGSIFVGI